ncbi:hypothetical protein GF352_02505 [archaeon]|nr:hypothetical protein [archaeon]
MAAWWELVLQFLLGILMQIGQILGVQFLNIGVLWQLLPVYTGWFAVQFITGHTEGKADWFLNGFSLLWVGFQLGEYIIQNFFTDPFIIFKTIAVVILFIYAVFVMRLTLLNKDVSKYLARIGEVSAINIAAMLFIQDLLVINNWVQGIQLVIGFILLYGLLDYLIIKAVDYIYEKAKIPMIEAEKEVKPRYERITKPAPRVPRPPARPPATRKPPATRPRPPPTAAPRPPSPPPATKPVTKKEVK